jgi:hypothetical protein
LIALTAAPSRADLDVQIAGGPGVSWIRTMPALTSAKTSMFARDLPEHEVPIGGSVTAIGGSFDAVFVLGDRWMVPIFGIGAYGAIGSYPAIVTSADGSIAHVRPWTTSEIDMLLPGVGYRVKRRRFQFSAALRPGLSHLDTSGSIAGGAVEEPTTFTGLSALLQVELEACRRLDPVTRGCLQIAPRIYDFGIMNGATFGLRVEWGR